MIENEELQSKTIKFLRFPLIIGIVFIHTNLAEVNIGGQLWAAKGQFPIHDIFRYIVSEELARIAVPLFYFMSGFLFFIHTDFSFSVYKKKLERRVHTLLIPYLLWNTVVVTLFFLAQTFLSSMTSGVNKLIVEYTVSDWIGIFWDKGDYMPISYQFWFIRDLMVVDLFSPLVYLFVRHLKVIGVTFLAISWYLGLCCPITGFSSDAFFFFSFGAWFAVHQHNFVSVFQPLRLPFTLLYILIVTIATILWYNQVEAHFLIHNLGIVIGLITIVAWTAFGIKEGEIRCNDLLSGSSFFIYAYHIMPLALIMKIWTTLFKSPTELTMILGYLSIPFLIVGLGIGIYVLAQKSFPRFTRLMTGGR